MKCGYQLAWFDLIPLFSYLFLGGKCRKCKEHISAQYPIVEGLNGVLYVLIFLFNGWSIDSIIYCLLTSSLIVLLVIDYREHEIPHGVNMFILALGLINLGFHLGDWVAYGIGLFAVSVFALGIYLISKGECLGREECLFVILSGLFLNWKGMILSCLTGIVVLAVYTAGRYLCKNEKKLPVGSMGAIAIYICLLASALWM